MIGMMKFLSVSAFAQGESIEIGQGTSKTTLAPIYTPHDHSVSQQLYTAEEIGTDGTITSIAFHWAYNGPKTYGIDVYMKHTERTYFETTNDRIPLSSSDKVFTGNINPNGDGWVSITLDTSGAGLHKRGYRADSNDAPIKETLAAAMAELAFVRPNHFVIDPMCGSGTILIEAAQKALKIAPGVNRYFACEKWSCIPDGVFEAERELARSRENRDCEFRAEGYDIDSTALETAGKNAEIAGVGDRITFAVRDIKDYVQPEGYATVITNPPYGERLLDIKSAEGLYKIMGERFVREKGKSYTIITPDDDFEKIFGRKADKRPKVYNGTLKCQIYHYFK